MTLMERIKIKDFLSFSREEMLDFVKEVQSQRFTQYQSDLEKKKRKTSTKKTKTKRAVNPEKKLEKLLEGCNEKELEKLMEQFDIEL